MFSQAEAVEQEHIQHPRPWPEQQSSPGRLRNHSAAADPPPQAAAEAAGEAAGGYRLEQRARVAEGRQRRRMYPAGLKDAGAVTAGPAPWGPGGGGAGASLPAYEAAAGVLRAPCGPGPRDGFVLRQLSKEEQQQQEQALEQERQQRFPIRRPRPVPPVLPEVAERVAEEKPEVRPATIVVPSSQPRQRSFSAAASFPRLAADEGGNGVKPGRQPGWGRLRQLLRSGQLGRQWGVTYES